MKTRSLLVVGFSLLGLVTAGCPGPTTKTDAGTPDSGPSGFGIGGTVAGLAGSGLVLENTGGDPLTVTADGAFTFAKRLSNGTAYAVAVRTQPSTPQQTCTVTNGSGTVAGADVTNVTVTCVTSTFTVGGTVSGLSGTGLVLQNNGGDDKTISGSGAFTFATKVASGAAYAVTVKTQPATQTCVVAGGTGTVGTGNVISVTVNCASTSFTIGGTITGLAGAAVLQNNGGDDLTINSTGTFAFPTTLATGATYAVTVLTQPSSPVQVCTVTNGSSTVGTANVTDVAITCTTTTFTVGGTISGLVGTVVLKNNGGDNLTRSANGSFTFATAVSSGQGYLVSVFTQPAGQTCTMTSGASGTVTTANIIDVVVTCVAQTFTVGGNISGLVGTVVLQNNGTNDLSKSTNGSYVFTTPVASGGAYLVSVLTPPTGQTCTVANAGGTVTAANITNANVTCAASTFTLGGTVTGLAASESVVLQNNGGSNKTVSVDGAYTFTAPVAYNSAYAVTVLTSPAGKVCSVVNGTGTATANVTNVDIACAPPTYSIGGTVTGLGAGATLTLQNNGGNDLPVTADGVFTFTTKLSPLAGYVVTITNQTGGGATCRLANATGAVGSSNVTGVVINCVANAYVIGGTVTGLTAGSLVLRNNAGNDLTLTGNGPFAFSTPVATTNTYAVAILTQPATHTCAVTNAGGMVATADVTTVTVTCGPKTYSIGGTISGLVGTVVLQNNGGNDLSKSVNGVYAFGTAVVAGTAYSVSVLTHPIGQTCTVAAPTGTVAAADVTNVNITCAASTHTIGGTVSGLAVGESVVLQNNGTNNRTVSTNVAYTFTAPITYNGAYLVTALTSPAGKVCSVANPSGNATANVTNVDVVCAPPTYSIGGTVTGLGASATVTLQNNGTNDLLVSADGTFTFTTKLSPLAGYSVSVSSQTGGGAACTPVNATGTVGSTNVTGVVINCVANAYVIGGTLTGLNGAVVLQNNAGNNLTLASSGPFAFTTPIANGNAFAVTVLTQPATQTCVVTTGTGSGSVTAANVSSVAVVCTTNSYSVGGTLSGLVGTVVLQNNGADSQTPANGPFAFVVPVPAGSPYAVTVLTQPTNQTCTVTNGSGTMGVANVTNVTVTCQASLSVMVMRVGDGGTALSSAATAAFLEERSAIDGTLLRTLPLPIAATGLQAALTLGGTSTSEGGLSLSSDRKFVTFGGYSAVPGVAAVAGTTSATVNRVIGRVNNAGTFDTSTLLSAAFSGGNIRSATSVDGSAFWASGNVSSVQYASLGSTGASTQLSAVTTTVNLRQLHVFAGQLYGSAGAGSLQSVYTVGTGLPTVAGQVLTPLPGLPTATGGQAYSFALLDLDTTAGVETLYIAQDAVPGVDKVNVQKWVLTGATWVQQTFAPTLTSTAGVKTLGLAAFATPVGVRLVVTTDETPSRLLSCLDTGTGSPAATVLSTAATFTAYRGVAFSPIP